MADEGALQLTLHPLVIINISDHFTRARTQSSEPAPRVMGVLIGAQTGRQIEVANSFEVKVVDGGARAAQSSRHSPRNRRQPSFY